MNSQYSIQNTAIDNDDEIHSLHSPQEASRHSLLQQDHQLPPKPSILHIVSSIGLFVEHHDLVPEYQSPISTTSASPKHHVKWNDIVDDLKKFKISDIQEKKSIKENLGLIYMLLAAFSWSIMSLCVKMLSLSREPIPTFELIWGRSFVILLISAIQIKIKKLSFLGPKEVRLLLVARGLVSFCGMAAGFLALTVLSIGDATALSFTAPIFTGIAAHFILNERWQIVDGLAAFFSLIGVILIARPPFIFPNSTSPSSVNNYGIILSLLGAVAGSAAFIIMRKLGRKVDPNQITLYFSAIPFVLCLFALPFTSEGTVWFIPQHFSTYAIFGCLAGSGYAGQMMFAKALQVETAAKASTYNFAQVFYSFIFEYCIYGKAPNLWSVSGATIIGTSIVGMTIYKISVQKKLDKAANLPK